LIYRIKGKAKYFLLIVFGQIWIYETVNKIGTKHFSTSTNVAWVYFFGFVIKNTISKIINSVNKVLKLILKMVSVNRAKLNASRKNKTVWCSRINVKE